MSEGPQCARLCIAVALGQGLGLRGLKASRKDSRPTCIQGLVALLSDDAPCSVEGALVERQCALDAILDCRRRACEGVGLLGMSNAQLVIGEACTQAGQAAREDVPWSRVFMTSRGCSRRTVATPALPPATPWCLHG